MTTLVNRLKAIQAIAESHLDDDDYIDTGQVVLDLQTIIDICKKGIAEKIPGVGILWEDDEGAEIVEELYVEDTREMGRWTQTVKEIVLREVKE